MDSEYLTALDPIEESDAIWAQKPKLILEAILFAASEPISLEQFQAVLTELDKARNSDRTQRAAPRLSRNGTQFSSR